MNKLLACGILAILFSFSSASMVSFPVSALEVDNYVEVSGNLTFYSVLPDYGYVRPVTIALVLPPESLDSLNASNVVVFAKLSLRKSVNSSVYFSDNDDAPSRFLRFNLTCVVENGACNPDSSLLKKVFVVFRLSPAELPYDDEVFVNYSFSPIPLTSIEEEADKVKSGIAIAEVQAGLAREFINNSSLVSDELGKIIESFDKNIKDAKQSADLLEIGKATGSLDAASRNLVKANQLANPGSSNNILPFAGQATSAAVRNPLALAMGFILLVISSYVYFKWKDKKRKRSTYSRLFE